MKKHYQNKPEFIFYHIFLGIIVFICNGCNSSPETLFIKLDDSETGIDFTNTITEYDTFNILTEEYIFNGGGVAVADFNNDGLQDIFFTGNQVPNRLYLNQDNMKFKDVSQVAKINAGEKWHSGAVVVDINNDGWQDIYVCATMKKDSSKRANMLFLNQGSGDDHIPVFEEVAEQYGIADMGHSTMAAFFDYDLDGDLDLYILTNQKLKDSPSNYRPKIVDGSSLNNDRLYRNNGDGTFKNVTKEAGILIEGFGLGLAITDINMDGWPDIYVSNDFVSNDLLWINNQDGTFSNEVDAYFKHQSHSAMGNDVADINNDGLVDVISVDMLPEDNKRKKMMIPANKYTTYVNNEKYDYEYQYVRNMMQLNRGIGPDGHPIFSEIGQFSGIFQTDWSWAPLLADFDNDGFRDLLITNGFPRDVTDHDFTSFSSGIGGSLVSKMALLDSIPKVKIPNYIYKNNGDLTFADKTKEWGLDIPSYSNGAAYADLDNDGDLDLVVNNINDKAFVFENSLYDDKKSDSLNHFLRLKLNGTGQNTAGVGTKVALNYGEGKIQVLENHLSRGYLSTIENVMHFGLGAASTIDSVQIYWPDGKYQLLLDVAADQVLEINKQDAESQHNKPLSAEIRLALHNALFEEAAKRLNIDLLHKEADKVDFNIQVTLPHKFSQKGPGIAVGDVDGNGLDDFYVSGSAGESGAFFLQGEDGKFTASSAHIKDSYIEQEELGVLLFDADDDKDLDLYIVGGSYEFQPKAKEHQDRLYLNDGKGRFSIDNEALPRLFSNGSAVKAADFDKDGDLDLFVGGSVVPGQYPLADESYILRNDDGKFVDITEEVAPALRNFGIVNDALWTDFDNDGNLDLILAGEWMPIIFFKNAGGVFEDITKSTGLEKYSGWWNSLTSGDYDNDGDIDYIAGNLGLNSILKGTKELPLSLYAKDFDGNGNIDPILFNYLKAQDGSLKQFPVHSKDDLTFLIPRMKKKFPKYAPYSVAGLNEVLSAEEKEGALVLEATRMESSYIENLGNGNFEMSALPIEAQLAPVFGLLTEDFDNDGNLDALVVGNSYATEVTIGRYDALTGLFLKGDGTGNFKARGLSSGFFVNGDAKGLVQLQGKNDEQVILVTQNQGDLRSFVLKASNHDNSPRAIKVNALDAWAEIEFIDGKKQKKEFYYGSGYLSQSARILWLGKNVKSVSIYDFSGNKREITLSPDLVLADKDH